MATTTKRDLAAIKSTNIQFKVLDPATGKPCGLVLDLLPMDHPTMKEAERAITNAAQHLARRNKNFKADEIEENYLTMCIAAINGWEWNDGITFHGEVPTFTPKNVKAVLSEITWLPNQITDQYDDTARFFRK